MAPPRAGLVRIVAASLLAAACSDVVAPRPRPPVIGAPEFDVAASGGTAANGTFGESGTALAMGFYPTNPHAGDAIVVTFFWLGSTNIIDSVTDRLANGTRVGNTYTLVEYVTARGLSMATYVATNAQNFPDPNPDQNAVLEVEAHLAGAVTDGGVMLSAYTGVNAVSAQAVGAHRSADGSGSSITVAAPGVIPVNAGALAYSVTLSNAGVAGLIRPTGFTSVIALGDAAMGSQGAYAPQVSADSIDPHWTWFFDGDAHCTSTSPCTWLATVLALNPEGQFQTEAAATQLAFTVQPSDTTAGRAISPPVQVTARDGAGNADATFSDTITVALGTNPSGGTLSGTTRVAAVNGVATFSNLSIDRAGNGYTLTANASGLTNATSASFTISPPPSPEAAGPIALDVWNGTAGFAGGTRMAKGFDPQSPKTGDAIVATFFWLGSTDIIDSVTDHLTNTDFSKVGNTYRRVEFVSFGGISMATYVATNVQVPQTQPPVVLAVNADLSEPVRDGGIIISAWSGVAGTFADAVGTSRSASGAASGQAQVGPGSISVNAGALAYGATMTAAIANVAYPSGFNPINLVSNDSLRGQAVYAVQSSAGTVAPQWTWFFDPDPRCTPSTPCAWLASVLALNPGAAPPPPPPPPPVDAAQSSVVASPTTITAGSGTSTITVTARDASGNPVSGATVTLTATGSGNTLTQPAGPTNSSGVATGTLSSTVAGTKAVSATAGGVTITQTAAVTVTPGGVSASQSTVTAAPTSITAGSGTSTITVTARDASGNPVSGATVTLSASGSGNTLTQPASPTNASGVATGTLSSTTAGSKTVTATAGGVTLTQTASITVTAGPVSASQSTVTASPTSITAGSGTSTITVTARDANGNAVSGATVVLAATGSGNTLTQPASTTNTSGVATGSLSSTTAGSKTVSATISGVAINQTATVTVTAGSVSASQSTVTASPTSITAGSGTSTITVTARDANGNPISGATVVLATTGSGNTLTQPASPTNASGVATGTLSSTTPETKTVSATISGVAVTQTATVTVTTGSVSASQSSVVASPTSITAGSGTSTITVTARDASGNPISGATVVLSATGSGNTLTQPAPTNGSGVATGSLSSTIAGSKTVSATISGVAITQTATVTVTAGPVSASQSTVTASPTSITAGSGTSTITVTARDANGNAVSGATVVLAASGSGNTLTQPAGPTSGSGVATGSLSSTVAGSKTVSATISGVAITQTATVTVTAPTGNLTVFTSTSGTSLDPDGYTVTVDGGNSRAIGINTSTTYNGLSATSHNVALSGVASTCAVSGSNPRSVTVPSGGTANTTFSVTCSTPNSAPVVNAGPDDQAFTGLLYSFSWSFSDANNNGPWSYTIDWGDGNTTTNSVSSQGTYSAGHTYIIILPQSFTIRVTVTDAAGASASDTKSVSVLLL